MPGGVSAWGSVCPGGVCPREDVFARGGGVYHVTYSIMHLHLRAVKIHQIQ